MTFACPRDQATTCSGLSYVAPFVAVTRCVSVSVTLCV